MKVWKKEKRQSSESMFVKPFHTKRVLEGMFRYAYDNIHPGGDVADVGCEIGFFSPGNGGALVPTTVVKLKLQGGTPPHLHPWIL